MFFFGRYLLFVLLCLAFLYLAREQQRLPLHLQPEFSDKGSGLALARLHLNNGTKAAQLCRAAGNDCVHVVYAATGSYVIPLITSMNRYD